MSGRCCECGERANPSLTVTGRDLNPARRGRSAAWCQRCWDRWTDEHAAQRAAADALRSRVDALLAEGRTAEAMVLVQEARR